MSKKPLFYTMIGATLLGALIAVIIEVFRNRD